MSDLPNTAVIQKMPPPLKQCKDCGASVSKSAPSCPQCGAILKRKSSCLGSLVAILLLIFFVPFFIALFGKGSSSARPGDGIARSSSSSPPAQPTGGTSAQTTHAEQYIPGIAGVDVYGNLKDRGFSVNREFGKGAVFWTCESSNPLASYRVDVTARTPTQVMYVSGTLLYSGDKQADPFAKPFFGYLATLPYTGSNPEEARKWVEKNIGNIGAKTSFGDVEFLISGNEKSRILQLRNKNSATSPAPVTTLSTQTTPAPSTNWRYSHSDYEMGKGRVHHATAVSSNTVEFGFPYGGSQRGTLFLRTHPKHGKDVILSIERGQFLVRSYEDSKALVRFDDGEPVTCEVVGAEDHSTTSVFFRDYQDFVSRMLKAKRVRISVPVYQQGSPVFEFDVSGFDAKAYLEQKDKD